ERERRGHPLNLWTREHLHHLASPELLPTQHKFILGEEFEDGGDSVTLSFCAFSTDVSFILFYTKLFCKPNDPCLLSCRCCSLWIVFCVSVFGCFNTCFQDCSIVLPLPHKKSRTRPAWFSWAFPWHLAAARRGICAPPCIAPVLLPTFDFVRLAV